MSLEPINPFRPPESPGDAVARGSDEYTALRERLRGDTRGRRVAGIFLLANASLAIVAFFAAEMLTSPIGIALDLLVGFLLVRGYGDAAKIVLFKIVLAMFLSVMAGLAGNWDSLALGVPHAASLLFLVVGKPGKVRFAIGCVLIALVFAANAAIVLLVATSST